jgi:hypothetical protein
MTKDDIRLLYEYGRWANNRVLQAASSLSAEEFTRDLGGSFRSVRKMLLHIIGGEWVWLAYCKAQSHGSALVTDLKTRRDALFNPDEFPNVRCGPVKVVGNREGTDRVRGSGNKRTLRKNAPFSHNTS